MKYIYSHLGLGDQIICNALIRELTKNDEEYLLFVKFPNLKSISFMFKDLKNLYFMGVRDDGEVFQYLLKNLITKENIILIGFCDMPMNSAEDFDDTFYLQHGVNFEKRWSGFKVDRDISEEKKLFDKFGVNENEYVFLHDDVSRGYEIDETHIKNKNLPIIRPLNGLSENIFDYCYLMQNSIESHFIDSSFRLIFDSLKLRNKNIFFHINLKNGITKDKLISHSTLDFFKI